MRTQAGGLCRAASLALAGVWLLGGCAGEPGGGADPGAIVSLPSPAGPGSLVPRLRATPDGTAVLSWLEPAGAESHALRFSRLEDGEWSAPQQVAAGSDWFVNWADFPSVAPLTAERWAAHWLVKRPGGTYAYDIALALSTDAGLTWRAPLTPHDDDTRTEHGFVSLFPWLDGVGAVWLDGRNMQPDRGEAASHAGHGEGAMSLRYARFGFDGAVQVEGEIDDHVCDCCQTDVALGSAGPVLAYRGRTVDEIRDIQVTRYLDGAWTPPITVGADSWRIPGCPVNGPAIAARGDRVVVAWYAAPNRQARVALAFSDDAGGSFSAPLIVEEGGVGGRVAVLLLDDGAALVSWIGRAGEGPGQIRMRRMAPGQSPGPIRVIAEGDVSRASGFPQMVRARDGLVFAWTTTGEPTQVLSATAPLP